MKNLGALRHRITFESPAYAKDSYGQAIASWTVETGAWAEISPLSAGRDTGVREAVIAGEEAAIDMVKARLRPVTGITPAWRFTWNGSTYDIKGLHLNNLGDELVIYAQVQRG